MSQTILETVVQITGDITGLKTSLNSATNETNNALNEVENSGRGMSSKLGGQFTNLGATLKTAVTSAALAGAAALGALAISGAKAAFDLGNSYDKALNKIKATTGATEEEAKKLGESIKAVFAQGYGESLDEVADAVGKVKQQFQSLDDKSIQSITEDAFDLSEAFDVDVDESIGAAKTLMKDYGVTSKEAFDMIAYGFQNGLNASGDWLDTIQEYGPQFKEAGFSAKEFFSIIQTGAANGVLGTDKVADLVKEFGLRIADGSKATSDALKELNLSADEVNKKLASGEWTKGQVFVEIHKRLAKVTDATERQRLGVQLMGTQYEDMGQKAVAAIDVSVNKQKEMAGAMEKVRKQNEDINAVMTSAWRQIQVALIPVGTLLLDLAKKGMPYVIEGAKTLAGWITNLSNTFKNNEKDVGGWQTKVKPYIDTVIKIIYSLWDTAKVVFKGIQDVYNKVLVPVFTALAPLAKAAFGVVTGIMQTFAGFIKGVFGAIFLILKGDWGAAWNYFKTAVTNGVNNAGKTISTFAEDFKKMFAAILQNIVIWGENLGAQLGAAVVNGFNKAKQNAAKGVNNFVNGFKEGLGIPKGDVIKVPAAGEVKPQLKGYIQVMPVTTTNGPVPVNSSKVVVAGTSRPVTSPTQSIASTKPITPTQAPKDATWDLAKDTQALKKLIDNLNLAAKYGKVSAQQVEVFNNKLTEMGNRATEAGVRNNSVVASLFAQGKAAAASASQVVAASEAKKKAQDEEKKSLSNLKSAVKDMTLAEVNRRIEQEKDKPNVDQKRLAILLEAQHTKQIQEQKKAKEQLAAATKVANDTAIQAAKDARDTALKNREESLNQGLDAALKAAGDNLEAQLKVYQQYKPKFVQLEKDKAAAVKQDAIDAENAKYKEAFDAAKKAGLSTATLTKNHNAVLAGINQTFRLAEQKASKELDEKIADTSKKVKDEALKAQTKTANEEFDKQTKAQVAKINSMTTEQLIAFKNSLQSMKGHYEGLKEAGKDVIKKIDDISARVTEAIKTNTEKASEYFKNLLKDQNDIQDKITVIKAGLNPDNQQETAESYAVNKLKPVNSALDGLSKTLETARANLANMSPSDEGYTQAKKFVEDLEKLVTNSQKSLQEAHKKYVAEWNQTESDKAENSKVEAAKNKLALNQITQAQYREQLTSSTKYWEDRLKGEKEGSDNWLAIQGKLVSIAGEIKSTASNEVKDAIDGLSLDKLANPEDLTKAEGSLTKLKEQYKDFPEALNLISDAFDKVHEKQNKLTTDAGKKAVDRLDLTDPEKVDANINKLSKLENTYKEFPEVLEVIQKAFETLADTVSKTTAKNEKDFADLENTVDNAAESLDNFSTKYTKYQDELGKSELETKKDDAQLALDAIEAQQEALLETAKTEKDKARITLEWSEKVRLAKLEVAAAELKVALAANEAARAQALASEEALGQEDRINALYDRLANNLKTQNSNTVKAITSTTNAQNKAAKETINSHADIAEKITKYADYAQTGIGLLTKGLVAFGGMSEEVANQWGEDLSNMVNDIVNIGTAIAKGDWLSAAVGALTTIFNWINRNKKAAQEAAKATEDYQKQFKFISGDQFRQVEKYTTGFLFWQTDHYKETLDDLGVEITKTLDSGIGSGLSSGIQNYLNGTGGVAEAIYSSLREAIVNAIVQAVIESKIIKEKLGPILEDLAKDIRNNLDPTETLQKLKATIPVVSASLEATLSPIKDVLDDIFPSVEKAADKAIDKVKEFVQKLAEGIQSGVDGGFKSGMQKFLEGGTVVDMFEGIKAGIRGAIVNGIIDAVMNGAIIQGSLGGLLKQLTEAIASGSDPSQIINSIAGVLPSIVSTLEKTLSPIKDALKVLDPVLAAPVPTAPEVTSPITTGNNASSGVTSGVVSQNTVNNNVDLKFYISEASDADKIARMVERKLTRNILRS